MIKYSILSFLTLIFTLPAHSLTFDVKVQLFNQFNIKTVVVSPSEGKYEFIADNSKVYKLRKNNIIYFTLIGDSISVWDSDQHLGMHKSLKFVGLLKQNNFKIESAYPALPARFYEGDLEISCENQNLKVVNSVNIDDYLAGVVEAEAGPKAPFEFYKAQAVISRTYLMSIINKEGPDQYKVCDDVNYQVYKGMSVQNPLIRLAVAHTHGLVIVDSLMQLITAAFHSNSGGQTANSEDVWQSQTSYLKAVPDPFSLDQRNTNWQDTISIKDWILYLKENGFDIDEQTVPKDKLAFEQNDRLKYYAFDNDTLSLKKIRKDFELRSSWFSIFPQGDSLVFAGRGYGHGVGLSQEGAMQMARLNYSFLDIIYYYYKNIKVVEDDFLTSQK